MATEVSRIRFICRTHNCSLTGRLTYDEDMPGQTEGWKFLDLSEMICPGMSAEWDKDPGKEFNCHWVIEAE